MKKIKIIICDDHPLISKGFQNFIQTKEDMEFVGAVSSEQELNAFLEKKEADVLILDVQLPDNCGTEICKNVLKKYPDLKIIGLSNIVESSVIIKMMQNGASGYLVKSAPITELELAIHTVVAGDVYLEGTAQRAVALCSIKKQQTIPPTTSREKDVLKLLAEGLTSVEIAEILFISSQTVYSHRKNLLHKFKVNKTVNLISKAKELGLI